LKALASIGRRRAFFLHLSWLAPTFAEFEVAISRNNDLQQLGFSAPSGFSRWYHAQFGCSPKESRAARGTVRR
jgi:hypothetical protein